MANISLPKLSKRKSNSPIRFSFNEKKKSGKNSSTSKKRATKNPTYLEMIKEAITELKERNGSSLIAIAKYIENKYNVVSTFRSRLKYALKKATKEGKFLQIKKSFKLPTEKKRVKKSPKKMVPKSPDVNLNTYSPGNLSGLDSPEGSSRESDYDSEREYRQKISSRVRRRLFC